MAGHSAKGRAEHSPRSSETKAAKLTGAVRSTGTVRPAGAAVRKAAISGPAQPLGLGRGKSAAPRAEGTAKGKAKGAAGASVPVLEVAGLLAGGGGEGAEASEPARGARPGLKSVVLQPMSSFGKHLAMRPRGREVQQEIDSLLRSLPPESVLVIDFEGVEMMDYSFADEALGAIFSRLSAKEYPNRYIVLAAGEGDLAEALIENVEVALARREVAALVLPKEGIEEALGADGKRRTGPMPVVLRADAGEWRVAGTLPQHLIETLRAVMDRQQVTVRELADELQIDSATACNNRIARLYQLRLVRREAAIVPEGGRQYFYSSVI